MRNYFALSILLPSILNKQFADLDTIIIQLCMLNIELQSQLFLRVTPHHKGRRGRDRMVVGFTPQLS